MKRILLSAALLLCVLLSSCAAATYIPEDQDTFALVRDNLDLFQLAVEETVQNDFDCTIASTVYYKPDEAAELSGLFIYNVEKKQAEKYSSKYYTSLSENCSVKLIDLARRGELTLCSFGMCKPGRDFDYGVYYVSEDRPVYLGDPGVELEEKGDGYSYTRSASYGSTISFYTEKIAPNFYYYEIS